MVNYNGNNMAMQRHRALISRRSKWKYGCPRAISNASQPTFYHIAPEGSQYEVNAWQVYHFIEVTSVWSLQQSLLLYLASRICELRMKMSFCWERGQNVHWVLANCGSEELTVKGKQYHFNSRYFNYCLPLIVPLIIPLVRCLCYHYATFIWGKSVCLNNLRIFANSQQHLKFIYPLSLISVWRLFLCKANQFKEDNRDRRD